MREVVKEAVKDEQEREAMRDEQGSESVSAEESASGDERKVKVVRGLRYW